MTRFGKIALMVIISVMIASISGCTSEDGPALETQSNGLYSNAFADGGTISDTFTCNGKGISPPLSWTNPPEGTESYALTLSDPDAPYGTFTHWLVWNIPSAARSVPEDMSEAGSMDPGITEGTNDFGEIGYGAPCPPPGPAHRYIFRLFALDFTPDLPAGSDIEMLENAMTGHILAEYDLTGIYGR